MQNRAKSVCSWWQFQSWPWLFSNPRDRISVVLNCVPSRIIFHLNCIIWVGAFDNANYFLTCLLQLVPTSAIFINWNTALIFLKTSPFNWKTVLMLFILILYITNWASKIWNITYSRAKRIQIKICSSFYSLVLWWGMK